MPRQRRPGAPASARDLDLSDLGRFEQHVWEQHGLRLEHLFQVIEDSPRLYARGKQYLVLGRTLGGSVLTIALRLSHRGRAWRPVTMYESDNRDKAKYEGQEK